MTVVTAEQAWAEEAAKREAADVAPVIEAAPVDPPPAEAVVEPEPAQEVVKEPEPDPFAGVPEIVRTKLARIDELAEANGRLANDLKATQGRVSALQSEAAKAARQVVAAKDAPSAAQIAEASKSVEKWNEAKKDWPEWADAMEQFVASKIPAPVAPGIDEGRVTTLVEERLAQARAEMSKAINSDLVEDKHAGWTDKVKTPEFNAFFAAQSPEFQALAHSPHARDTIKVLDAFEASKVKGQAASIKDARSSKLAAAAAPAPGQSAPPPKSLDDMSPQELWNYEAAQRAKTASSRGY